MHPIYEYHIGRREAFFRKRNEITDCLFYSHVLKLGLNLLSVAQISCKSVGTVL
jgi:hypothetical protein